jgi:hypothetical protein
LGRRSTAGRPNRYPGRVLTPAAEGRHTPGGPTGVPCCRPILTLPFTGPAVRDEHAVESRVEPVTKDVQVHKRTVSHRWF